MTLSGSSPRHALGYGRVWCAPGASLILFFSGLFEERDEAGTREGFRPGERGTAVAGVGGGEVGTGCEEQGRQLAVVVVDRLVEGREAVRAGAGVEAGGVAQQGARLIAPTEHPEGCDLRRCAMVDEPAGGFRLPEAGGKDERCFRVGKPGGRPDASGETFDIRDRPAGDDLCELHRVPVGG